MLLQGAPGRAQHRSGRSELEPHMTWRASFVAPVISRVLDEAKTEAPNAVQVEPWSDEANVVRRRPLLHLDSDVIVVGLYDHADDITALVQARRTSSRRLSSTGGGMASFSADRARSGALLSGGRITSLRRMAAHLAILALRVCVCLTPDRVPRMTVRETMSTI